MFNNCSTNNVLLYCILFITFCFPVYAAELSDVDVLREQQKELLKLDLQELLEVQVISVAKKSQKLSASAAAVFVITQEDIHRSSAQNIPELLKMVPGVQVARINAYAYAISVRGFNSSFANKLLVLVDGRSVYTPEFSGVYWDSVDMPLENIERIEVIRGTGGTLWGANAVNGVINILTKHTEDTKGSLVSANLGTKQKYTATARQGGVLSDDHHINYRVSAKLSEHNDFPEQMNELSVDSRWEKKELSFRLDGEPKEGTNWLLTGNYHKIALGEDQWELGVAQVDVSNMNLLSRWEQDFSDNNQLTAQLYYDYNKREDLSLFTMDNRTVDFELQYQFNPNDTHNLLLGIGYRHVTAETPFSTFYEFQNLKGSLYNIFVQDDIHLVPNEWTLTVGTKLEHHYYTGLELQPNIRLLWTLSEKSTLWTSISRAVRTPSRLEYNTKTERPIFPGEPNPYAPEPLTIVRSGNSDLQAESVIAYELGMRQQLYDVFSIDVATFVNRYTDLILMEENYLLTSEGYTRLSQQTNGMKANSYGIELALNWIMNERWKLLGAYTWTHIKADSQADKIFETDYSAAVETRTPRHQFSLRSNLNLTDQLELDFWLYHVSELPMQKQFTDFYVPSYTSVDARLAWHPTKNLELSLVGQNLFDKQHTEFAGEPLLLYFREDVQRNIYGQIRWNF